MLAVAFKVVGSVCQQTFWCARMVFNSWKRITNPRCLCLHGRWTILNTVLVIVTVSKVYICVVNVCLHLFVRLLMW